MPTKTSDRVVLLAGGVGAARFLRGLVLATDPSRLTVIVNTGDDEEFYGLSVSPDLDTIIYTLAGLTPERRGWGIKDDSFHALGQLKRLYGQAWFMLGDRDLATHIYRSERLGQGQSLARVTAAICESYALKTRVLPMSNQPVRTIIHTSRGPLPFQEYLVAKRGRPRPQRISFRGAAAARPAPGVVAAIKSADRILVAPSNPFVSIAPMLAVKGIRRALVDRRGRVTAISPLVAGKAVKGPLDSMIRNLGSGPANTTIADFYRRLAARLVVDRGDTPARQKDGWPHILEYDVLIPTAARAARLARFTLGLD